MFHMCLLNLIYYRSAAFILRSIISTQREYLLDTTHSGGYTTTLPTLTNTLTLAQDDTDKVVRYHIEIAQYRLQEVYMEQWDVNTERERRTDILGGSPKIRILH